MFKSKGITHKINECKFQHAVAAIVVYLWKLTPICKPYVIEHGNSITLLPLCAAFDPANFEMATIANANVHTKHQMH